MKRNPSRRRGFTLIEVLLVLVILVVLASLAVMAYGPVQRRANINAAKTQIGLFKTPLQTYQMTVHRFPVSLDDLRNQPADVNPEQWDGPYLDAAVPLDPWGNPYQYVAPGAHNPDSYDLWSWGPDGVNGTDDDITNWSN